MAVARSVGSVSKLQRIWWSRRGRAAAILGGVSREHFIQMGWRYIGRSGKRRCRKRGGKRLL